MSREICNCLFITSGHNVQKWKGKEMKSDKAGTWLMDDAFYSLNTAYNNGINTVGIYDDSSKLHQEKVKSVSTIYIKDWTQVKQLIADMNL